MSSIYAQLMWSQVFAGKHQFPMFTEHFPLHTVQFIDWRIWSPYNVKQPLVYHNPIMFDIYLDFNVDSPISYWNQWKPMDFWDSKKTQQQLRNLEKRVK